jgi:hypothetical protein
MACNMNEPSLNRLVAKGTKHIDRVRALAHPVQTPWAT